MEEDGEEEGEIGIAVCANPTTGDCSGIRMERDLRSVRMGAAHIGGVVAATMLIKIVSQGK